MTKEIFSIKDEDGFEAIALKIFAFQAVHCEVYKKYLSALGISPLDVRRLHEIPFLPIGFFKTQEVVSSTDPVQVVFSSSGTTGMIQSRHLVTDISVYEESFLRAFNLFYGDVEEVCLLALLPSYLEREGSSLIYMVDALLAKSRHTDSGYFLHNHDELYEVLIRQRQAGQKTVLIGVTYALLDFIERFKPDFPELIVMETGGMKGKRKEMVREELHMALCNGFGIAGVHSEYGMTELLSQAYSPGAGIFHCPPWMKVLARDTNDPLTLLEAGRTGGINIIDLANVNSCSFIATQDLGRVYVDGSFEVLGRFDNADIRGCNLLVG
ncbi:LuxE/PaaK family acyltransferase [Pedobacter deserti]|uniref:LuxE/PaaK family acyltransferase n=1 Tax=Pedobacter deserti TaxID=2817382 RepID=UPI00210AAC08|nr:acyl transferase [Pedobacter sp. SYSU D00382]